MSKQIIQNYLKKSDNINIKIIHDNKKELKLEVDGKYKEMSNSGFSKKQIEQLSSLMDLKLQPVISRLDKIESRIDVLESFHEDDFKKKSKK